MRQQRRTRQGFSLQVGFEARLRLGQDRVARQRMGIGLEQVLGTGRIGSDKRQKNEECGADASR